MRFDDLTRATQSWLDGGLCRAAARLNSGSRLMLVLAGATFAACAADATELDAEPAAEPTAVESALSATPCGLTLAAKRNVPGISPAFAPTAFSIPSTITLSETTSPAPFAVMQLNFSNGGTQKALCTYASTGALIDCGGQSVSTPVTADKVVLTLLTASTTANAAATIQASKANPCDDANACTEDSCSGSTTAGNNVLSCANTNQCRSLAVAPLANGKSYIVDSANPTKPFRIHGVDRAGAHWACLPAEVALKKNDSAGLVFRGPVDQSSVDAMILQGVNAVRIPLNEDCWLGLNSGNADIDSTVSGSVNRQAVQDYVELLTVKNKFVVVLDLHWNAPGTQTAVGQLAMADRDHSPAFWTSVATMFKGNPAVIFNLYNEPLLKNDLEPTSAEWNCWLNGTTGAVASNNCAGKDGNPLPYAAAGMAELYKAVRDTGATNVVLMGGLYFAHEFGSVPTGSGWVPSVKKIPKPFNIAASYHQYAKDKNTTCPGSCSASTPSTIQSTLTTPQGVTDVLNAGFAVLIGEIGDQFLNSTETPNTKAWLPSFLTWADNNQLGYLGWNWNTDGAAAPGLLGSDVTTPTLSPAGTIYFNHLKTTSY